MKINEVMTPQEEWLRQMIEKPYYHNEDEHGTYVRAENKRAIAAAKRMLKNGEVLDVVDKSYKAGQGTNVGGQAYFDPITKSWGNYRKQTTEPLAHVYIKLNNVEEAKVPRKGTVAWERQRKEREDYLKGFAKDPHGRLQPGDKIAGHDGEATFKGKLDEGLNNLISIWVKHNTEGKKVDKLYVFQNEIGGYSYTVEYMGGTKRGQSKVMHMSYDELKAKLEENGWHLQED